MWRQYGERRHLFPGLPAPLNRHAPHRQQHQQHRQPPRPARHHHLTGGTPHQETRPRARDDPGEVRPTPYRRVPGGAGSNPARAGPGLRNASPGDITKTTPPGGGDSQADGAPGPGPRPRFPRGGARGDGAPLPARPWMTGPDPAPGEDPPVGVVRNPDDGACGVRVRSGWTLDEENRNRSRAPHALPLCPADAFESTISAAGPVDGPGLGRGRAPRWSGCPGRRRPRAHAPGDFGSGRGSINLRARRRGRRLRAGRIRRRARR